MCRACGVCVLFIALSGALEQLAGGGDSLTMIFSIALGGFLGECLDIDRRFEQFGQWLKVRTGNARDKRFVDAFVSASLTVSIGAMAIVGAIQDGIMGDPTLLYTKAALDFTIVLVMTSSMGRGCIFSAIPVAALQGSVTHLSQYLKPLMTSAALDNLSLVGSVLVFCVGLNLVWEKTVRAANLLPAVVLAVAAAFLPL